ncbi:MraY family glycosyltransferase [Robbsia betulipollinis]
METSAAPLAWPFPVTTLPVAYLLTFACGWALSGAILWMLLKTGWAWSLATDVPNHRSLHTQPTPRVGGWGLVPVALTGMLAWAPALRGIAFLALCLAVISQIDDRRGLPARVRFAAHALAAVWVAYSATDVRWWALPLLVVALIWVMNLYNFMDGTDGLAGGMALFGFGSFAVAAASSDMPLAGTCFTLAGAALGFLIFNFPPARLFLGDAGSVPLGFFVGALGLAGWRAEAWNPVFPLLVFSPFLLDASTTLLKRILRGERFWEAHREHYYQRMIRMNWGRRRVLALWYASMLAASALALSLSLLSACPGSWIIGTAFWLFILLSAGITIDRYWKKFCQRDIPGALASRGKKRNV